MLVLASSSSAPGHRGSIERGVDGGDHRVIGGLGTEMGGDRLQEMIALSDRQRRRRRSNPGWRWSSRLVATVASERRLSAIRVHVLADLETRVRRPSRMPISPAALLITHPRLTAAYCLAKILGLL